MLACILAIVLLACAQEAVTQRSTCRQASCCTPTPYIELSFTLYLDAPELSDCEAPELLDRGVRLMALIEGYDAWTPIRFYSRTTNSTAIDGIPLAILTEDSHVLVRDIPRLGGNRTYPLRLIRSSEPVHITEYLCGDFAQPNTDFIWIQYMTGEVNKDENVWYLDDITLRYWDGYCLRVIVQQDFSNSTLSDKFSFARGSVQPPLCGLTNSDGNVFFLNGESVNMARPRHRRRFRMQNLIYMNRSCVQSANDLETYAPGYDHDVCSIGSTDCLCNKGYRQNSSHCLDINECAEGTDNCSQHCINTEGSFKCACYSGYRLNEEATTCDDIDDCTENLHNCSHECVNLDGGYKCLCGSGYVVGGDGFTCQEQAVIGFLLPMFEVIRGESSDVCVGLLGGSLSTSVTINLLIINTNCSTNKNFSLALDALTPIVCVNVSAMENGLKCEIFTLLLRTTHSAVILNPNATTVHILDPKLST